MPYLFNRTGRLAPGNPIAAMSWAVEMTAKVNSVVDTPFSLWSSTLSPRVGTLAWSAIVSDLAELAAIEEKLIADGGYLEMVDKGSEFWSVEGLDDAVVSIVHAQPYERDTLQYASITTTTLAPGCAAKGIQLGVEIADQIHAVSGCSTMFGTSLTGAYGEVGWIVLCDSIEQLQHLNDSLSANQEWLTMLDERASKMYSAGTGVRSISRKIA